MSTTFFIALLGVFLSCASTQHKENDSAEWVKRGNIQAQKGNSSAAISFYEQALKEDPDFVVAKRNLGIVLARRGQYKRSRVYLEKVLQSYPTDSEVYFYLGESHRGLADYYQASLFYRKGLRYSAGDIRIRKALGWTYFRMGEYKKAIKLLKKYTTERPLDMQVRLILASSYNQMQRPLMALSLLKAFESSGLSKKYADNLARQNEKALLTSALADSYRQLGQTEKAQSLYIKVLKVRPFYINALTGVARTELSMGRPEKAAKRLERAVLASPNQPEPHYLLGKAYQKLDKKKSEHHYKQFLRLVEGQSRYSIMKKKSQDALLSLSTKNPKR